MFRSIFAAETNSYVRVTVLSAVQPHLLVHKDWVLFAWKMALKMPLESHRQVKLMGMQDTAGSAGLKVSQWHIRSSLAISTKQRLLPTCGRSCKMRSQQNWPRPMSAKPNGGRCHHCWNLQQGLVHLRKSYPCRNDEMNTFQPPYFMPETKFFYGVMEQHLITFVLLLFLILMQELHSQWSYVVNM